MRVSGGIGSPIPSAQRDALTLEGYASPRWVFSLEAGPYLSEQFVLTGFALTSVRSDAPSYGGPTLREDVYAVVFNQKGLMAGIGLQGSKITHFNP